MGYVTDVATHKGKIAAEIIAGRTVESQALTILSVAYTESEIFWRGITETEAKGQGIRYESGISLSSQCRRTCPNCSPQPILLEALRVSAEMIDGSITDLSLRKR